MAATTSPLLVSVPASSTTDAPKPPSPRFTLELEFVLCLSNPYYLSHLALTYPHLLNAPVPVKPSSELHQQQPKEKEKQTVADSDATKFANYLSYLYDYWRRPEYARFLTYPSATLRNLELLQQEQFRRDIIRPDVIERLLAAAATAAPSGNDVVTDPKVGVDGDDDVKEQRRLEAV